MTNAEKLVDAINHYVSVHGTGTIKDGVQILNIAGLLSSKGNILPSDFCYNRYNFGLKDFDGPFLFEYLGVNQYLILGEHYPYSGSIIHKPKGGVEVVVGEWINGKKILNYDKLNSLRKGK